MNIHQQSIEAITTECPKEFAAVRSCFNVHRNVHFHLSQRYLLPGQARARRLQIEQADHIASSHDEIEGFGRKLTELAHIENNASVQLAGRRQANSKFLAIAPAIASLHTAVDKVFFRLIAEAKESETTYFGGYGLEREETAVSRAYVAEKVKFAQKVEKFNAACRAITEQPTGGHVPEMDCGEWLPFFETQAVMAEPPSAEEQKIIDEVSAVLNRLIEQDIELDKRNTKLGEMNAEIERLQAEIASHKAG